MNRTERLTAILLLLQEKPRTAGQIAQRFEVSRRTILRDVQALCEMGVPVIAREGPGGGYALPETYTLEPLALSSNEALLLVLALEAISHLSDAPHSVERVSLVAKIRALLPQRQLDGLERILEVVSLPVPERSQRAPYLDEIIQAAAEGSWRLLTYRSAEGPRQMRILPLEVSSQNGYWYCRAAVYEQQAERTFRIDRILKLEPTGSDFQPGPPPIPLPYDHPSHPEIQAELTRRGARMVEVDEYIARNLRPRQDGSASLVFRCPPSELDYYARFFAGLGPEVRVLAPQELRARLRALGELLEKTYPPE